MLTDRYVLLTALRPDGSSGSQLAIQRGIAGFKKPVVLRPVPAAQLPHPEAENRFLAEVKAAVLIDHPSIAKLYEIEALDNRLYLVTQFCPGATFDEVAEACAQARQKPPFAVLVRATLEAALALHHVHTFKDPLLRARALVHGALCPGSLLIGFDGATRVLDLGYPFQGQADALRVRFAAPEVLRGETLDARADVFSLAAVLHCVLTGTKLSYAEALSRSGAAVAAASSKNPEVPPALDAVLAKALSYPREARFADMKAFAAELEKAVALPKPPPNAKVFLERLFGARLEELSSVVSAEEEKITTAVMSLGQIFQPSGALGLDEVEAAPTRLTPSLREMPVVRGTKPQPVPEEPPPTGRLKSPNLDELPPTGELKAPVRPRRSHTFDEVPAEAPRGSGLKRFFAFVLFLVACASVAWGLKPDWVRGQLNALKELARGKAPIEAVVELPEDAGVLEDAGAVEQFEDAGEQDAGQEESDAGVALDAGVETSDGGILDAGAMPAKAPAKKAPPPKKTKRRQR